MALKPKKKAGKTASSGRSFNVKKYDAEDFSKNLDDLDLETFAIGMHKRLVSVAKVIKEDTGHVDPHEVKRLLADYPSLYSWAIVEYRLIDARYNEEKEKFDFKMKEWFDEMSNAMEEKATQKAIDAAIYKEYKEEIDGFKKEIRDLEAKSKVALGMLEVWKAGVHTAQSLSKHIALDLELSKIRHKHGA